jgi:hypothetical protein
VVLLADRGQGHAALARTAAGPDWHYLLRLQRRIRVRLPDGTIREIGALVPPPGPARDRRGCIAGAAVGAPRRQRGATWASDWDAAIATNIVALSGSDGEPWLLITDLPASPARCREYRHRTQEEEELFRDLKSFGWQWQDSHLRLPDRVDRLLLALVLATLWIDALAHDVLQHGWRHLIEDRPRRCYSRFHLGLRWLRRTRANDQHVPCSFALLPDPSPPENCHEGRGWCPPLVFTAIDREWVAVSSHARAGTSGARGG